MCGIFCFINDDKVNNLKNILLNKQLSEEFYKTKHRGPDNSVLMNINKQVIMGFHRLCINDTTKNGNQPFQLTQYPDVTLICNGEIYNYKELAKQYDIKLESNSDCEIILHLHQKFGLSKKVKMLDGVFAFVIYNSKTNQLFIARDPFGIRSLYIGTSPNENQLYISSELKSIQNLVDNCIQYPHGHYSEIDINDNFLDLNTKKFYDLSGYNFVHKANHKDPEEYQTALSNLKEFTKAVQKRLLSDRPIGCLLSGGLDSSLVTALVAREFQNKIKITHFQLA